MTHRPPAIAIDPGQTGGGIAWKHPEEPAVAVKMPPTPRAICRLIGNLITQNPHFVAVLEKVGAHLDGNSASSSAKFARHCGFLEGALEMAGVPLYPPGGVPPKKWQAALSLTRHPPIPTEWDKKAQRAERARRKAVRKHEIQSLMQGR